MRDLSKRLEEYETVDLDKPVHHPLRNKRVRELEILIKRTYKALDSFPGEANSDTEISEVGDVWNINCLPLLRSLVNLYDALCSVRGTTFDYFNLASVKVQLAGELRFASSAKPLYEEAVRLLDKPVFLEKSDPDLFTLLADANYHIGIFSSPGPERVSYLEVAYHNAYEAMSLRERLSTSQCHYFGRIHVDFATSATGKQYEFRDYLYKKGIELLAKSLKRSDSLDDHRELGFAYFYAASFYRSRSAKLEAARQSQILLTEAVDRGESDVRVIDAISRLAKVLHKN